MTEKLKQIIKREVGKLPKETQEAINAVDWANIAEQIGKKYLLNESEINDFQVQTLLVLVGLRDAELYEINIENDIETTKDVATQMADEAFQKILTPISNIMAENIKKNMVGKNPSWEQNVDFVLSGGNYFAFMTLSPQIGNSDKEKPNTLVGQRSMQDIKDKFNL